jgi:hypothetical protein
VTPPLGRIVCGRVLLGLFVAAVPWHDQLSAAEAEVVRLVVRAADAFEQGQGAWGVRLGDGGGVGLYDRVLVEDDGPGIGSDADWLKTDRAPTTEITGNIRVKKLLHIDRPGAKEARLCVPSGVAIEVNGQPIETSAGTHFPRVPPSLLKEGDNEVILSCLGGKRRTVKIALPEDILRNAPDRHQRPRRSFKSIDDGKTWEPVEGEYMVRLHLIQHVPQGHFISPVIDLSQRETPQRELRPAGAHDGQPQAEPERSLPSPPRPQGEGTTDSAPRQAGATQLVETRTTIPGLAKREDRGEGEENEARLAASLKRPVSIQSLSLSADAETPEGTRIELALRTGRSPVYEATQWSDWQAAGTPVPSASRYLQWKAALTSADPLKTPLLRSVTVEAKVSRPATPAWAKGLHVVSLHNEQVRYTSLPFEYEDPLHPRLVALRRKYQLDAVVAGSSTETEQLVRLRDWVAHQWKYNPPVENYPAWDADEILSRKCGFCVQYAITFMQCAISLGHQARFVFGHNPGAFDGGGHEVCEIWSNEHRKWILFDVNGDWHYVDPQTRAPMSMLEVHDLILKTYFAGQPVAPANTPRQRQASEALAICYGTNLTPGLPPKEFEIHYVDGHYTVPTRWLFVNYMPRNNFLASPYPQPKTQGAHWDWSEYWCWEDALTPKRWLYRNFTARRSDLDWTINQACFDATLADRPGELTVQMGTFTPHFDTFLVKVDEQAWATSARAFTWKLHSGRNRIAMRARNTAHVEGPASFLEVEYSR